MAKRGMYKFGDASNGIPAGLEGLGNTHKMAGIVVQGNGGTGPDVSLVLLPEAWEIEWLSDLAVYHPSAEEWEAILSRMDDPLVFQRDESGTIKAIVRKQQRAISGAIQQKVWVRDEFTCMYCGCKMGDCQLTVDHFVPLELDGTDEMANYISACRKCNKEKGAEHPQMYCASKNMDYFGLVEYLGGRATRWFIGHLMEI